MTLIHSILGYLVCSAAIIYAGSRLSFYGDRIAEITGMGKAWIGLILMASITSLPELMTGVSAVVFVDEPDLAAGDIFGSCVFNLLILAVLDGFVKKPLTAQVRTTHVFAGAFGIILLTLTAIGIILAGRIPAIGWISSMTPVIFGVYLAAIWLIYHFENKQPKPAGDLIPEEHDPRALRRTLTLYGFNALIVVAAAVFLPFFGDHIAEESGLGMTFMGTMFLALSTSLPELVVAISAVRLGALDMAVGNIFGSNIFNIFILGIDDVFYRKGSLLSNINPSHLFTILVVILMTAVAILGLLYKPQKKRLLLAPDTLMIVVLYILLLGFLVMTAGKG